MTDEIVEKLKKFFEAHPRVTEECHVVYVMIELRKLLEHEQATKTSPLTFYCDWVVHTKKDKITDDIKLMIREIYQDIRQRITDPACIGAPDYRSKLVEIIYFEALKGEMQFYLNNKGISTSIITDHDSWRTFVSLLVKVLENQPINNPTEDVVAFTFVTANEGCCYGRIDFAKPINEYTHFNFGNAY